MNLLYEATQGRLLLQKIVPEKQFKNTKAKALAQKAHTDIKRIEQEVREELFKVGTRGLDNLVALGKKEGGDAEAIRNALKVFGKHLQKGLEILKVQIGAPNADQPPGPSASG
jgi:adenylate cyclase